jgi:TonB-linked SusC/RagA family outer membrane protein
MKHSHFSRVLSLCIGLLLLCAGAYSQTRIINGRVLDDQEQPLPNASVTIKNTKEKGTLTDENGNFKISISSNNAILVISSVGFANKEVAVGIQSSINASLVKTANVLDEVVVTALGIKREKRQLTYSSQEVKGEVIAATKEPGLLNALTGRVSGVQITSSTGAPGSSSRIVIRGQGSITGSSEALIVLDGVPINNAETGNAGPGAGMSRISDIDPAIIESINVLKGSAASALYGSAGAKGVVLITTKSGASNRKPSINFSSQVSFEKPILPMVQDKYALGDNGIYSDGLTGKTSLVWGPRIDTLKVNGAPVYYQNPMKQFFQTGITNTNTMSVSGGQGKSNYFLSYSYLNQKGTVPTTDLLRHTVFAKYTTAVSDKFSTTLQFSYTSSVNNRVPEGYDLVSPLWTIYTAPFTYNLLPVYDAQGSQRLFRNSRNNPYWVLDNVHNKSVVNRFIPVINFTYTPLSWLTITERLGADVFAEQTKYYEAPSNLLATPGTTTDFVSNFRQYNHDLIIEARKKLGSDWNLNVILGNNLISTYSQSNSITGTGLAINNFQNISNASTITASENYSLRRKVGFYMQSNIEYKKMLNISATGRYDGTSVLANGRNFYSYGSASLGFVFSELTHIPALDFGKLRVSYSKVGNDNVGAYSLLTPYVNAGSFPYNGVLGFGLSTTANNDLLKNETTTEFEIGLETRFLKNRFGFEISYFDRKHTDLLTSVSTSNATGYASTTVNAADMTNKGIEALLNVTPIKSKKFSWDMIFSFTRIKNKIIKIYQNQASLATGQTQAFVGEPFGTFFNIGYQRNADGRILINDVGLPIPTTNNIKIGNIQPDWLGGLNSTLNYDNLSLSFFFDTRKGGDILNSDERYGYFYGTPKVTENRNDRVIPGIRQSDGRENTVSTSAKQYYQRMNLIYESIIQDGSYIKLRNVNFTYQFKPTTLKHLPFSAASFSLTGRNLFIYSPNFTGADPETSSYGSSAGSQGVYGYSTPSSRSFNLTLNVTLK